MWKCCDPLARTWEMEVARGCHPWEDPSVTAEAGNPGSAETKCPQGVKRDLEQGRGGDRGQLTSWTASPNMENCNNQSIPGQCGCRASRAWLLHPPFLSSRKWRSAKQIRNAFRTKFNYIYSTTDICSYPSSTFFTWPWKPIKTVFMKSIQKNVRWSEIVK